MELAVVAKNKGDDDKIAQGLIKLMDEDKTFAFETVRLECRRGEWNS